MRKAHRESASRATADEPRPRCTRHALLPSRSSSRQTVSTRTAATRWVATTPTGRRRRYSRRASRRDAVRLRAMTRPLGPTRCAYERSNPSWHRRRRRPYRGGGAAGRALLPASWPEAHCARSPRSQMKRDRRRPAGKGRARLRARSTCAVWYRRTAAWTQRRQRHPAVDHASLRATSSTLSDRACGNIASVSIVRQGTGRRTEPELDLDNPHSPAMRTRSTAAGRAVDRCVLKAHDP